MPLPHIQFDSSQAATTPYYPSNGVGAWTATVTDSFVLDFATTELRRLIVPDTASGAIPIEFYHGDDSLAFKTTVVASSMNRDLKWDQGEGPELRGNWYIEFPSIASATDFWFIQFQQVT
jgi:hypothetical protein